MTTQDCLVTFSPCRNGWMHSFQREKSVGRVKFCLGTHPQPPEIGSQLCNSGHLYILVNKSFQETVAPVNRATVPFTKIATLGMVGHCAHK